MHIVTREWAVKHSDIYLELTHRIVVTMRPSNGQTLLALQRVLDALKEMSIRWPAAQRAWELVHGAQTHLHNGFPHYPIGERHHKRAADDAFGLSEKVSDVLQQEAFEERSRTHAPATTDAVGSPHSPSAANTDRVLAHMLGLDIPGIEPSTSYLPGYEWWPRNGGPPPPGSAVQSAGQTPTPTSASATAPRPAPGSNTIPGAGGTESPSPHSTASSPPSAMPIPFSFDVTQQFWAPVPPAPSSAGAALPADYGLSQRQFGHR
jgi:hypothetical protein